MFGATGGQYFQGDGDTYDFSGNVGFDLGGKGFLSITGEKRFRGFCQRGGQDIRVADVNGNGASGTSLQRHRIPRLSRVNHYGSGDPESMLTTVFDNSNMTSCRT